MQSLDEDEAVVSAYKWKSNLLCGFYKQEISSSVYFPSKKEFQWNVPHKDLDQKKHSLKVVKHSMMRLKTTKQEVCVFNSPDSSHLNNYSSSTKTVENIKIPEKINKINSPETTKQLRSNEFQTTENFQTPQSKQFIRNFLKSRSGSLTDVVHDVEPSSVGEEIHAVALKDCVPSPYDREALSFKKGDVIKVTTMNSNGIWRGTTGNREGYFKFIDVKLQNKFNSNSSSSHKRRLSKIYNNNNNNKSKSVSDLLSAVQLENLNSVFILNGFNTMDDIESAEDLDYLGLDDFSKSVIIDSFNSSGEPTSSNSTISP